MMYRFSEKSQDRLRTLNPELIQLIRDSLSRSSIDFGIPAYGGRRTAEEQMQLFVNGKSKCNGCDKISKHQTGNAVDVFAYVNGAATWDKEYYYMIADVVLGLAKLRGLKVRWGGDWDRDLDFNDQSFNDLCHFELID